MPLLTYFIAPEGFVNANGANVTLNQAYSALSRQFEIAEPTPAHLSIPTQGEISIPCEDLTLKKGELPTNVTEDVTIKPILPAKSSEKLCRCMMDTVTCVSNPDSSLGSHLDRMSTLWSKCENLTSPFQPKYCYGTRIVSDAGLFDSFIHCNASEKISWHYSQFSNSSEVCSSLDGLVVTPTPTTSLAQNCQMLLRQAGVSGTGTITNFPPDATSISTEELNLSNKLSMGGKVGIGVAVSLFILSIIGGYIIYRRANMTAVRKKAVEAVEVAEVAEYQKPELPDTSNLKGSVIKVNSSEVHELEGSGAILQEADSGGARVEVVGDFGAVELESQGHIALRPDAISKTAEK
jgi:hypothetical protein